MAFDPATAQPISGGGFDPSTASPIQADQTGGQPHQIPSISAAPEQGVWDRIKTEARNALSPILGETPDQKAQREADMQQLGRISPTLASYASQAAPTNRGVVGAATDMLLQGGGAVAGQELGSFGGPFDMVTIPLLGAAGGAGGDYLAQKRRIAAGEQQDIDKGELAQAAITGAIPGGNLAKTGGGAVALQGLKQGVGGLAGETAHTLIDQGQLPQWKDAAWASILPALAGSFAEGVQQASPEITAARTTAEQQIAQKAGILKKAQDEGFVVEPSQVNPSLVNKGVESLAGGPSIRQAATHINNDVADDIARRVLDPQNPDTALTSQVAQAVRQRAYDVGYRPVAQAGQITTDPQFAQDLQNIVANRQGAARSFPGAVNNDVSDMVKGISVGSFDSGDAIKMTQILRNDASKSFAQGDKELGMAQRQAAGAIEDQIERHLQTHGNFNAPDLLDNFRDARTLMAQSHDIEDAIREGGNSVIPSVFGAKFQAGKPLSGGLDTIGGFANNFPTVTREAARTAVPGTTVTGNFARVIGGATMAGAAGAATHSPAASLLAGIAGVALPSVRGLVRNLVLSGPYQRIMAKIPVKVEARPDLGALMIRQGGQAAATQMDEGQPSGAAQPQPLPAPL